LLSAKKSHKSVDDVSNETKWLRFLGSPCSYTVKCTCASSEKKYAGVSRQSLMSNLNKRHEH